MPFQPYGYRFEIVSPLRPAAAKAAIAERRRALLDPMTGARGWTIGPFMCLWLSAFDRHGPMLFGRIAPHLAGCRISGRAGSDLNGLIVLTIYVPMMVALVAITVRDEGASSRSFLIACGVMLLMPLILWWSHKDRRKAEPLVRFLHDAVSEEGRKHRRKWADVQSSRPLEMTISGDKHDGHATAEAVYAALLSLGEGDFVILEEDGERYIQALSRGSSYWIEKRDGGPSRHFFAVRHPPLVGAGAAAGEFTLDETMAVLAAYLAAEPMPHGLGWERMQLPG